MTEYVWVPLTLRTLPDALREAFRRPCTCNGCTGRSINRSRNRRVSHGLKMKVGKDGRMHWWSKSWINSND